MTCFHPRQGYRARRLNPSGKRSIVFNQSDGYKDMPQTVPCGQCSGCRLERSRQWAIRCVHEASLYKNNCFITLTYAPDHLPKFGSLHYPHYQKFMKDLREKFREPENNKFRIVQKGIRFYMCGEYGELNARPHYHACLFNFDFPDREFYKPNRGFPLYRSETLEELWPFGHTSVGNLTFESAAYTARYITKKITGAAAVDHYCTYDERGEITSERIPEFTHMSLRGGIGRDWFVRYSADVFPADSVVIRGKEMMPPKYYDRLFDQAFPAQAKIIKAQRQNRAKNNINNNAVRLAVREELQERKLKQLKRGYESNET